MKTIIRFIAFFVLVATLVGCRADVGVDVMVKDDGTGKISAVVVLDKEIAGQISEPDKLFKLDDLRRVGWTIKGPDKTPQGGLKIRAEHSFNSASQASELFKQLGEPFRNLRFSQDRSTLILATRFMGKVDLTGGIASVDNDELEESLKAIANDSLTVASFEKALNLEISIDVPGASKTFKPQFGTSTAIDVKGRFPNRTVVLFGLAAIFALLSLTSGLRIRHLRPRRGKHFRTAPL